MSEQLTAPVDQLQFIKDGLIELGYANADTPLIVIQDLYYKYIIVRQTGFNPDIPYAIGLLPDGCLKEALLGKDNNGNVESA